jgi:hypothetical protein
MDGSIEGKVVRYNELLLYTTARSALYYIWLSLAANTKKHVPGQGHLQAHGAPTIAEIGYSYCVYIQCPWVSLHTLAVWVFRCFQYHA